MEKDCSGRLRRKISKDKSRKRTMHLNNLGAETRQPGFTHHVDYHLWYFSRLAGQGGGHDH